MSGMSLSFARIGLEMSGMSGMSRVFARVVSKMSGESECLEYYVFFARRGVDVSGLFKSLERRAFSAAVAPKTVRRV